MKTIIAGSRNIHGVHHVREAMTEIRRAHHNFHVSMVVSGTARGIDRDGEAWALEEGLPVARFPANWEEYGKAAGFIRNQEMATFADQLVAIWDGESKGTADMISRSEKKGMPVYKWVIQQANIIDHDNQASLPGHQARG